MQMQGNMYYAYTHIKDYQGWVELFNIVEWEPIAQKRLLAGVSGAILPLVALGFIKSLVDYIKPEDEVAPTRVENLDVIAEEINHPQPEIEVESYNPLVNDTYDSPEKEIKDWDVTLQDGLEDEIDGLEMGQIVSEESEPIEVDVIKVKNSPGLVAQNKTEVRRVGGNSIVDHMTVYDTNSRSYVSVENSGK
jgi:hypothetical protein